MVIRPRLVWTRRIVVSVLMAAGAACGIDIEGAPSEDRPELPLPEAGEPTRPDGSPPEPLEDAASPDAPDAPDAPPFCDRDASELRLCLRFEGDVADESKYAQPIDVTGEVAFEPGVSGSAASLDGGALIVAPHGLPWQTYTDLTIEAWIKPSSLPLSGGRAGIVDKNASFGLFLMANGDLFCSPGPRVAGVEAFAWVHVACVFTGGKTTVYAGGVAIGESTAGALVPSTDVLAIGSNSPSGEPFLGALDGVRIYARAKTKSEIAAAAAR